MTDNQATIEQRLALVEGATDTLIKGQDKIQADLRAMKTEITGQLANMQQDLHLIVDMYRTLHQASQQQQQQLNRIEARLSGDQPKEQ